MRSLPYLLGVLICLNAALASFPVQAATERTVLRIDRTGVYSDQERGLETRRASDETGGAVVSDGLRDGVLWQRSYIDAMYTTAAILAGQGSLAAGTSLNPPKEAEYIPLEGQGTPTWVYPSADIYVSASRDGEVIGGVAWQPGWTTATLYKWHAGSSVPDWSYQYDCANPGVCRTIAVSADGSTIAVIGRSGAGRTFILYFSSGSGTPLGTFWSTTSSYPRNIALTAHGEYMTLLDSSDAFVVDRGTGNVRWHGTGGGSDAMAFSEDGNFLAYGWTTLRMYQWNGTTYGLLWTSSGGTYQLSRCAFSADGSTFAAGWYHYPNYDQNRIQLFELPSSTPLWTCLYTQSMGGYNDMPSDLALTQDGGYLAVASWGNEFNVNPELQVFAHASSVPVFTLDTPGSMFDTDIVGFPGGAYVVTCGKHVHANNFGSGGDLFCIRIGEPSSVAAAGPATDPGIRILPQPFVAGGSIRWSAASSSSVLSILDSRGSLVRTLTGGRPAGQGFEASWDGRDARGLAVPAGVYFCKTDHRGDQRKAKLVLTR